MVEILIVLAVFGLMAGAAVFTFRGAKNKALLDDAQAALISAFEQARSRAATGVGTSSHGVYLEQDRAVIFEGKEYKGSGEIIPLSALLDSSTSTIIFNRLSATSSSQEITLQNSSGERTIEITKDGIIRLKNNQ